MFHPILTCVSICLTCISVCLTCVSVCLICVSVCLTCVSVCMTRVSVCLTCVSVCLTCVSVCLTCVSVCLTWVESTTATALTSRAVSQPMGSSRPISVSSTRLCCAPTERSWRPANLARQHFITSAVNHFYGNVHSSSSLGVKVMTV